MMRVYVICEGQTESLFVRDVIAPHLLTYEINLIATLIGVPGHRGGNVQFDRLRHSIATRLKQDPRAYCTTLVDFYGLPTNFPGFNQARGLSDSTNRYRTILQAMTAAMASDLGDQMRRFIPYVQMHEFEGILFSDPDILATTLNQTGLANRLARIRADYASPEDINDSPDSAPSKRLRSLYGAYNKVLHGNRIARAIGLPALRAACPLFHGWVTQLETLSPG